MVPVPHKNMYKSNNLFTNCYQLVSEFRVFVVDFDHEMSKNA